LFFRESYEGGKYINRFSVQSTGSTQVNSRAVVTYDGTDAGVGQWTCTKDGGGHCTHINAACDHLQSLLQSRMEPQDDVAESIGALFSAACQRI